MGSEENNCRLGLVLHAVSESKQLGHNAGGKPDKKRLVGGETEEIHLHARGSSGSAGCTKEQMKLLGHGSATGGAGLHRHMHAHTLSLKCITLHSDRNHRGQNVTKRISNNPDWLSWRLIGWSGAIKTPRRTQFYAWAVSSQLFWDQTFESSQADDGQSIRFLIANLLHLTQLSMMKHASSSWVRFGAKAKVLFKKKRKTWRMARWRPFTFRDPTQTTG